jgi:exodeoxyribonuclease VIII
MLHPSDKLTEKEKQIIQKDLNMNNIIKETDEWYYNDTSFITNSHLKVLADGGPEALKHYFEKGSEDKPEFAFGRAFHCLILEPEEFTNRYYIFDDTDICKEIGGARPTATKKYKEWREQLSMDNFGKEMISLYDMNILEEMESKLHSIPEFKALLENTVRETIYKGNIEGIPVKCKVDACKPQRVVIDLKTTAKPPTPYNFTKDLNNYKYTRQAAFYKEITGCEQVVFIAIQKTAPYTVGIYRLSDEKLDEGWDQVMFGINTYKELYLNNNNIDNFYYQGSI